MSTHQRWRHVRDLYDAASPLDEAARKEYLDQHCPDPGLRVEVEKLLLTESTSTNADSIHQPAAHEILPPGTVLGPYKIQKRLGAGGMGLVYDAVDEKLLRAVAIKVIQPGSAAADDRARFLREAQSVSALNHPNIVTVYAAGHQDGLDFIAMERIEGVTLSRKIGPKGLDVHTALRYSIQIADAVAAAHEAGIVHRDLKPGNVMVTERDVVKVLDFGLAKRQFKAGGAHESLTGEGRIVGTIAYMSPEQAQGRPVDMRSDIFSFGSVLYEMLTGVKAFDQNSTIGTLAAILDKDPPPLQNVPAPLARVIAKCLRKKPHDRWQDMGDLKLILAGILEDLDAPPNTPAPTPPQPSRAWFIPAVIACGLAAGALATYAWMRTQSPVHTAPEPVYRMVTADNGLNDYPALSRDGKFIAFASDRAGNDNLDIWLKQIGGRELIQLTKDPADETDPSFSPDGTHVAFRSERDGGGIYVVQTLGGDPVLLIQGGRNPRYSPDGKWIAYWTGRYEESYVPGSSKVFVIDSNGGQPRQIHPEVTVAQFPVWSPHGDALMVYGASSVSGAALAYWVLPVGAGEAHETTIVSVLHSLSRTQGFRPEGPPLDWIDSNGSWLTSAYETGDSTNLWDSRLDSQYRVAGPPRRSTSGPGRQEHASRALTDSSDRLGFSDLTRNYDIWSATAAPSAAPPVRITDSIAADWVPSVTSDGQQLLYIARRSGSWALVLRDLASNRERVLLTSAFMPVSAAISGDGTRVVYSDDDYNINAMSTKGGEIQNFPGQRGTIRSLSSDGRYAAFEPVKDEDVLLFDTAARTVITLARRPAPDFILSGTHLSADGKWVAFHSIDHASRRTRIWVAPVDLNSPAPQSSWIPVTGDDTFAQDPCWSPSGDVLYFSSERDGFRCFWGRHFDSKSKKPAGDPFPVRHFHTARETLRGTVTTSYRNGLSAAAGRLFYSIAESKGNIWLEDRERAR
ncbi:MAG TPA: protein kinase [Bryobacteraceae bacterium]|jgi:serine/threonine protein kinase